MINESIQKSKYEMTTDTNHEDLEKFQSFLYLNFKSHPSHNDMRPVSNQPARFFAIAETHKFDDYSLVNVNSLKLRPITDLNVFIRAYNLIINRMTRSENMVEKNNQIDPKFW